MEILTRVRQLLQPNTGGIPVIMPYQYNPADLDAGYCTLYELSRDELTTGAESVLLVDESLTAQISSVNKITYQVSFHKFVDAANNNASSVAEALRVWLKSAYAVDAFNKLGMALCPTWGALRIDSYLESARKKWVTHAHFELAVYVNTAILVPDVSLVDISWRTTKI